MLDFQNHMYKNIGKRIRKHRDQLGLTQEKFVAAFTFKHSVNLDASRMSSIENGKTYSYKNNYLLTPNQIEAFSKNLNCEPKELIFGNYGEREESIKIFLLAIIMNSEQTIEKDEKKYIIPFMDNIFKTKNNREILILFNDYLKDNVEEKERVLKPTRAYDEKTAERMGIKIILEWFENEYPFFTSNKNVENYLNIVGGSNFEINQISNLLIKLLLGNLDFSKFLTSKFRVALYNKSESSYSILDLSSFKKNLGQYGGILVRNKDGFQLFVHAFNDMWVRHKKVFVEYFEKNLFTSENSTSRYRELNDELFHKLITSSKLSSIVYSLIESEKFSFKTMDGHYLFYRSMYEMTQEEMFYG